MKRKVNRKSVKKNAPMSNDNFRGSNLGTNFAIVYEKPNSDVAYTQTINANSIKEAEEKFYAKHPTCNILNISKEYGLGGKVDDIDSEISSNDLKEELREKMKDGDDVIHFAYTDYGGDFLDKVAIEYFEENYPKNIVSEDTAYSGKNAFVFGKPATEWLEASQNYLLGFDNIEEYYYQRQTEVEYEGYNDFLKDLRMSYAFNKKKVLDWLMENRSGYYTITTQGLDYSTDDLIEVLENEGLIKKSKEYGGGGETPMARHGMEINDKFMRGGIAGDVYSLQNPEQFKELITIYNDLSEKTNLIKGYYLDHTDNSIVFLTSPNISDLGKDEIYSYVESLKKKGFSIINFDKSIDVQKYEFGLDWGTEKGSMVKQDGKEVKGNPQWFKLYLKRQIKYDGGGETPMARKGMEVGSYKKEEYMKPIGKVSYYFYIYNEDGERDDILYFDSFQDAKNEYDAYAKHEKEDVIYYNVQFETNFAPFSFETGVVTPNGKRIPQIREGVSIKSMAKNGMEVDDLKGGLKNYYVQVENSRGGVSKLIVTDSYEEAEKFYYRATEDMDYDEINYAEFVAEFNNGEKEIIDFEYADAEYKTWNEAPYGDDDDEYKPWPEAPYGDDDDEDKFGGGGETQMARNGMEVKNWSASDVSNAKYLGILEFEDTQGELHNFEVMETEDRLVFGGMTNSGFIESGYIEKDGRSTNETLDNLVADLDVYYTEGVEYTSEIVVNQRMANGGKFGGGGSIAEGNYHMILSQAKEVQHHVSELQDILKKEDDIEAWVVAKMQDVSSTLSDVTHYLDGKSEIPMAKRGMKVGKGQYSIDYLKMKQDELDEDGSTNVSYDEETEKWFWEDYSNDIYRDGFSNEYDAYDDLIGYLDNKNPKAKRGMKVANDELPTYDIHLDYVNKSDNDFYYDSMEEIGEFVNSVATEKEIDRYEEMGYDFDHIFGMEMSTKNEGVIFIPRNEKFRNKIVEFIKGKYGNKIRVTSKETTDINLNAKAKRGMKVGEIKYPTITLKEYDLNDDQTEIYAYIETRQELQSQYDTIRKNLMTKIARGEFDETKAPKLFMYLVENGLKLYSKNFGEISLSKQEKEEIANNMVVEFMSEAELRNYENETFLPKKYLAENGMVVMTYDIYDENGECVGYGMMGQDVVDYANLLWYYDMMDEDLEEIDDFDVAKDYLEQDGFNIESHNPEKSSSATKKRKIIRKMKK